MLTFHITVGSCSINAKSPGETFAEYSQVVTAMGMDKAFQVVTATMQRRGLRPVGRLVTEVVS